MEMACFYHMFDGCIGLTKAPELPATTLTNTCYAAMFKGCTSLTEAPELPATTLTDTCYSMMFYGCTGLTKAPELPATTLGPYCYNDMFYDCVSLTEAPELPATTLTDSCYRHMFYGCTSLTEAPELPATALPRQCYQQMFYNCTGIKFSETKTGEYWYKYKILADSVGTNALDNMFSGVEGINGAPVPGKTYYMKTARKPSAEAVKAFENKSGYYYTYGTKKGTDNNKAYIIYVYDDDLNAADYIAVKGTKDNTLKELDTSKRIDTVYKSIKFPDESILDVDTLTGSSNKYFVAIRLDNSDRTFVPDASKFEFAPEKNTNENGN
ncbi:MAG: leucine-rich repeat protein [Firmicutes bacterium]|nr:leucine-rich repeat protein [Bacillota bacterium]